MGTFQALKQKLSIRPRLRAFASEILETYFEKNFSKNIDIELNKRALQTTCDYVEKKMPQIRNFPDKYTLLNFALEKVTLSGFFCEFGVYTGGTLRHIANNTHQTVHGFDSFEGLPEDWRGNVGKGHFGLKNLPHFTQKNIQLHVGWFDDTLIPFVEEQKDNIAFLHIDCDLYSSTKTIFKFLTPYITVGTVIVFDEYFNYPLWEQHEYKAFQEFIQNTGLKYRYLGYNVKAEQVAVIIES